MRDQHLTSISLRVWFNIYVAVVALLLHIATAACHAHLAHQLLPSSGGCMLLRSRRAQQSNHVVCGGTADR
jgi:hypothetical protein